MLEHSNQKNTVRINRILDLISSFGFEVERGIITPSECRNMNEYHKLYNKYEWLYLTDDNAQTFHIKELKQWVFNIELLTPEKPYDPEAIIWGMWIPGIDKYKSSRTPYIIKLIIDPYGKENNRFWDNAGNLKELLVFIAKHKWVARYYSFLEYYSLTDYVSPYKAKKQMKKMLFKDKLKTSKENSLKDFIINISLPFNKFCKQIGNYEITYEEEKLIITTDFITDKYLNQLDTKLYKNHINYDIIVLEGDDKNGESQIE